MKHLFILRHGKAAAKGTKGGDHGRPLTGRGRRQSQAVAAHLAERRAAGAVVPDLVLTSSAARARATAEPVHGALSASSPLEIEDDLYGADADDVVARLRVLPDDTASVMVVGHNPTLQELALLLVDVDDAGRGRLDDFPTAALAVVALAVDHWTSVAPGTGRLEELFVPER